MKIWAYRSFLPLAGVLTTVTGFGCEGASAVDVTTGPTAGAAAKCQPVLGASSSLGADGGSGTVSITTQPECGWTASTQAPWITDLSPTSGQGSAQLAFRAAPNTEPSAREADIVVNNDHVRVVQEAARCIFGVRPGNLTFGASGGTTHAAVSVMDRCAWGASSSVAWISVASGAKGSGSGSSTFRVAQNTGPTRSGDIAVASQTFTVIQSAAAAGPSGGGGGGAGPAGNGDDEDNDDDDGDDNSGKGKGKGKGKGGKGKSDTL